MDPGPVSEPKRIVKPQPSNSDTDAIIESEFKGKKATFFNKDQLDAIANGPLGKLPLGGIIGSIQLALNRLKTKKK